ncbi:MAG: hypothetical protein WDZ41_04980 [Candidatus Babeliales bacterium]
MIYFLYSFLFISIFSQAQEYIYPVSYSAFENAIYFIYQKDLNTVELWKKSLKSKKMVKALPSRFIPAAFRLLPDLKSFSFIHNDAIYIKYFNKRSPKRIEFYEPIYGINNIEWIDNEHFYFAARSSGQYKIYKSDLLGNIECLINPKVGDVLSPQMIGNTLFYIEKNMDKKSYQVVKKDEQKKTFLYFSNKPINFLNMLSDFFGFFLEYFPEYTNDRIYFSYFCIKKDQANWCVQKLFNFSIPAAYLVDTEYRLYESILPFLPRYFDEKVYFCDCSHNNLGVLDIFSYDFITKIIEKKTNAMDDNSSYICPLIVDNRLWYGNLSLIKSNRCYDNDCQ